MIKVLSLFSGIGAFERAFCRIGLDWELVNYCEIDRWASLSYSMVNQCSESLNLRDVRTVTAETVRDRQVDLITYGFPCQDISIAGKQQGFVNDSGESTRSGLFFEALRIIKELRPRYAIAENVKALTSTKFKNEFATVLSSLEEAGYNNYWRVLNAKDYGIPQNRERIFIVSIRKDLDTHEFAFPDKLPLTKTLKDMLEPKVDEKYYINNERAKNLIEQIKEKYIITDSTPVDGTIFDPKVKDICNCISARYDAGIQNQKSIGCMVIEPSKINRLGNLYGENMGTSMGGNVYSPEGIMPTLTTSQGGNRQPLIAESNPIVIGSMQKHTAMNDDGVCPCLTTAMGTSGGNTPMVVEDGTRIKYTGSYGSGQRRKVYDMEFRIRKLTPKECFRLMGFLDEEFDRVHGISNSQLYKQAGNSIVVNVLSALLSQLFYMELV